MRDATARIKPIRATSSVTVAYLSTVNGFAFTAVKVVSATLRVHIRQKESKTMKKLIIALTAGLFATAAFAQAPSATAPITASSSSAKKAHKPGRSHRSHKAKSAMPASTSAGAGNNGASSTVAQ
jgi:hypothetical protein